MKQLKLDQKELELKRKRDREDIEKLREEETLKIKKEKKVLEQRIKNMQFSQTNNSQNGKIQAEAESLRRQLGQANV